MKPILALDVDGPINTFGTQDRKEVYECMAGDIPVTIPRSIPDYLRQLSKHFQIVWFSSWKRSANQKISPLVGLPDNLPVIDFDLYGSPKPGESRKFLGLLGWLKEHMAIAVVDDEIGVDMLEWSYARLSPTLLIQVDPRSGIQAHQVSKLIAFANEQAGGES